MAVKNALLGGTDWVDGDVLYAADLNATLNILANGMIHQKELTSAGEQSATSIITAASTTISANGGCLVSIYFSCQLKHSNADESNAARAYLVISGTNIGTWGFLAVNEIYAQVSATRYVTASLVPAQSVTFDWFSDSYQAFYLTLPVPLRIVDDTTTIAVKLDCVGTGTAYIKLIDVRIMYTKDALLD